jgi:hypothetical protein
LTTEHPKVTAYVPQPILNALDDWKSQNNIGSRSDKVIEKQRKLGNKENFAVWSCDRDPDSIAWTWFGSGGRGQPLRFTPCSGLGK